MNVRAMLALMPMLLPIAAAALQPQHAALPRPVDPALAPYAGTADSVGLPDGRMLHFVCMGKGSPTVILTAGMGDFAATAWGNIQADMSRITRVCSWDRPGSGLSDGTEAPVTVATTTADLEAALATGQISGPYVMVGHSLGSYESLLYTDRHPDNVVGMVLVDPSVPGQLELEQAVAPSLAAIDAEGSPLVKIYRTCAADIHAGVAGPAGPDPHGCFAYPPTWPLALRQAMAAKVSNPVQYEAMASFLTTFAMDSAAAINPDRNYHNLPLIVLTATARGTPPGLTGEQQAESVRFDAALDRRQAELAALSRRGVDKRVPGANHYIQRSKPQAVLDAVAEVVREARQSRTRSHD